ncbi:MAG: hypothetical protein GY754_08135 [bacterium]|nr:hypothetical protein [bacterium]
MLPSFLVIAPPGENRRVDLFQESLLKQDLPRARVLSYLDIITGKTSLEKYLTPETVIRLESPGEHFELEKELIAAGANTACSRRNGHCISAVSAGNLTEEHGRIYYPGQWFRGFKQLLKELKSKAGSALWMNDPEEIAIMFDKALCNKLLLQKGLPVPKALGAVSSYDELREKMKKAGLPRVFVKLASGSSASGVVAYETGARGAKEQAHTSVELIMEKGSPVLYNSLKVRRYTNHEEVKTIIDWLCAEGVHVEQWIPKSGYQHYSFDIRQVVIDMAAKQKVVRLSRSPMTNLHLGNKRGNPEELDLAPETWSLIDETARDAAGLFPNSLYAGVDILIPKQSSIPRVLEVNAFGDLLPGITLSGESTYDSEIKALLAKRSSGEAP